MPDLWVPGAAAPSLEDFVKRLQSSIAGFATRRGWDRATVVAELVDGTKLTLHSIRAEPGYGFITLCPYPEDEEQHWPQEGEEGECPPEEVIVPVGALKRITLGEPEERPSRFGFSITETSSG